MFESKTAKKIKVSLPIIIAGITLCFFLLIAIYTFLALQERPQEEVPPAAGQATTTEWARVPSVEELQETLGRPLNPGTAPSPEVLELMRTLGKPKRSADSPSPDVLKMLPKSQE